MKQFWLFVCILIPVFTVKGRGPVHAGGFSGYAVIKTDSGAVRHGGTAAHYIGEKYGGGIVFYVSDNGQHGLIASTADQNGGIPWYNGMTRWADAKGDGVGEGVNNTRIIMEKLLPDDTKGFFAAKACVDYTVKLAGVTYTDWYLPSKTELNLLYQQKNKVGGFANTNYWSSTEYKSNSAWIQYFGSGNQRVSNSEAYANAVRAIRSF